MKAVTKLYCDVLGCRSQVLTYLDFRIKICTTTVESVEKERNNIVGYGIYTVGLYILLVCKKNCNTQAPIYILIIGVIQ